MNNTPSTGTNSGKDISTLIQQLNVINRTIIDDGNKEIAELSAGFGVIGSGITSGFTSMQSTLNSMQVILAVISNNIANMASSGITIKNMPSGSNSGNSNSGSSNKIIPGTPFRPFVTGPEVVTPAKAQGIAAVTQQQI